MTIKELIEKLIEDKPGALAGIPPKRATALVRALFSEINKAIDGAEDGKVTIAGLGHFRVRQVEREVEGENVIRKQVSFRPAKEKPLSSGNGDSESVDPGAGE